MATYEELYTLHSDNDDLLHKVTVASWIAADKVRVEAPATANHAKRMIWAAQAMQGGNAQQMLNAILAQNSGATVAQITGSTDAAIQTAVDAAVDMVAGI